MKDNRMFKGIMPALVTPCDANGKLLKNSVKEIVNYQLSQGVDGFYVCGATGEGPMLRAETRMEMLETVLEVAKGRGKIIAHVGSPVATEVETLVKHAEASGADAISSLAPSFFFKFSDNETVEYYKRTASFTKLPFLVYATPLLGTNDVPGLIDRLMGIDNVIGCKFTIPNYYVLRKVRELNGGNINVINGPDEMLICGLTMGADGGIGSTYNVMPDWYVEEYKLFTSGKVMEAAQMQYKINHVVDTILKYGGVNGAVNPVKAILSLKGFDTGVFAYPGHMYTKDELAELKKEVLAEGLVL